MDINRVIRTVMYREHERKRRDLHIELSMLDDLGYIELSKYLLYDILNNINSVGMSVAKEFVDSGVYNDDSFKSIASKSHDKVKRLISFNLMLLALMIYCSDDDNKLKLGDIWSKAIKDTQREELYIASEFFCSELYRAYEIIDEHKMFDDIIKFT